MASVRQPIVPSIEWFLGVPFTPMPLERAAQWIAHRAPTSPFTFVTTPNAQHVVALARGDTRFSRAHAAAGLVLNDSSILRLLAKRWFDRDLPRAAGSDLTVHLFHHHIQPGDAITIIGGSSDVERRLRTNFGMRRVARFDPPIGFVHDPKEVERCVDFVLEHPARYIFLAVGGPQSEVVACRLLERGGATGTGLCIGSSLHFVTGVVPRAPAIFRRMNVEWAYRLWQNPRKHAKRVFVDSLPVLWIAYKYRWRSSHTRPGAVWR